jgi:hypothetical protein
LLGKVLQNAESTQAKSSDTGSSSVSTQTAKVSSVGLQASQTRSLTASSLPSFVSDDSEDSWVRKTLASEVNNPAPEEKSINVSNTGADSIEFDADKLKYFSTLSGAKTLATGYEREGAAAGDAAGNEIGSAGSTSDSATALSSARQKTTDVSVVSLESMLQNFDARIVSTDPLQGEVKTAEAPAPGGAVEGSVAQAQNLASNVKGAEKETDKSRGALSSSKLPQDLTENTDTGLLKTAPAEHPSSEWSFDGEPESSSDSAQKNTTQTPAAKFDLKETSVKGDAFNSADVKTATGNPDEISDKTVEKAVQAEPLSDQSGDSTGGLAQVAGLAAAMQPDGAVKADQAKAFVESAAPEAKAVQAGPLSDQSGDSTEGLAQVADLAAAVQPDGAVKADQAKAFVEPSAQGKIAIKREVIKDAGGETAPRQADEIAGKTVGKAVKAETQSSLEEVAAQPRGVVTNGAGRASSAFVSADPAEAGVKMTGQAGSTSEELRIGYPLQDSETESDESVSGKGSNSGLSMGESVPATTEVNPLKAAEGYVAVSGEDAALLAKGADKQPGVKDSIPEGAVFQNSASSFQGSEINVSETGSSAQNGSYYDPNHFSELVQGMREQLAGASGRQLVLEMEPAELGKISLKVEAKKDEISVVALTENESARQALMKHSPELRQGLEDQGLVLDKFMVDVNRDKSGGGNYAEGNNANGKNPPASKATKTVSIEAAPGTAYVRQTGGGSQISIFA